MAWDRYKGGLVSLFFSFLLLCLDSLGIYIPGTLALAYTGGLLPQIWCTMICTHISIFKCVQCNTEYKTFLCQRFTGST